MATINIAITATNPEFSTFADELGYPLEVFKTPEEMALIPEPWTTQDRLKPNPQSKTDFLLAYFKDSTVNELARVKIANIQRVVDTAKEAEKVAMRTAISNAVVVTTI